MFNQPIRPDIHYKSTRSYVQALIYVWNGSYSGKLGIIYDGVALR